MVYKSFDKKTSGSNIKNKNILNKELAEELHKPIIRKFKKKKSTLTFYWQYFGCRFSRYAIKVNKGFRFLLCFVDIYSKYVWVIPLKEKKVLQLLMLFRKF